MSYAGAVMVMFLFVIAYVGPPRRAAVVGRSTLADGQHHARGRDLLEVVGVAVGLGRRPARQQRPRRRELRHARRGSARLLLDHLVRSRGSCWLSWRRSRAPSSARKRFTPRRGGAGPMSMLSAAALQPDASSRHRSVPLRRRRARGTDPAQPADRAVLRFEVRVDEGQPGLDRVRAPRRRRRRAVSLAVMAVAASEVCVGSVHRRRPRRRLTLDVDEFAECADEVAAMTAARGCASSHRSRSGGGSRCSGSRVPRRAAGWISTASIFVAFAGLWSFFGLARMAASIGSSAAWTWLEARLRRRPLGARRPAQHDDDAHRLGVGGLIVLYSIGYMDGDREERRYFASHVAVRLSMLLLVEGGDLLLPARGFGLVGLVVPADRLLARPPDAVAAARRRS